MTTRLFIVLILALGFSYGHSADGSKMEARKQKVIGNISERIALLETFKSCVSSAAKKEDMKACRSTHREKMKALKDKMKSMRGQHKH